MGGITHDHGEVDDRATKTKRVSAAAPPPTMTVVPLVGSERVGSEHSQQDGTHGTTDLRYAAPELPLRLSADRAIGAVTAATCGVARERVPSAKLISVEERSGRRPAAWVTTT